MGILPWIHVVLAKKQYSEKIHSEKNNAFVVRNRNFDCTHWSNRIMPCSSNANANILNNDWWLSLEMAQCSMLSAT